MTKRILTLLTFLSISTLSVQAQGMRLVFEDVLYGTGTGLALSTSVMALQNDFNVDHFRWGVGVGVLYGVAIGGYDVYKSSGDNGYFVKGLFSNKNSTAAVVLLDTGYGAATGTLLGLSYSLIGKKPFGESLLKGYGIGLWGGFIFGLVDGIFLSDSSDLPFSSSGKDFYSSVPRVGDIRLSGPSAMLYAMPAEGGYEITPGWKAAGVSISF